MLENLGICTDWESRSAPRCLRGWINLAATEQIMYPHGSRQLSAP